jgi:hypothetical protein
MKNEIGSDPHLKHSRIMLSLKVVTKKRGRGLTPVGLGPLCFSIAQQPSGTQTSVFDTQHPDITRSDKFDTITLLICGNSCETSFR